MPGRPVLGAPGRGGAPPSRPTGGRGGRSAAGGTGSAPGRGAGRRPIPWLGANGLLPGRGAPGRFGCGRADGRAGGGPGRRAVSRPSPGALAAGRSVAEDGAWAAGASDAGACAAGASDAGAWTAGASDAGAWAAGAWTAGAWEAAVGVWTAGTSGVLAGPGRGPGRTGERCAVTGADAAAGADAAGAAWAGASWAPGVTAAPFGTPAARAAGTAVAAPWPFALSSAPNVSANLFTTGGSTVDDADLTNSPISLSLARTTLLSTPSSFASSWTRTLATLLLLVRACVPLGAAGPLAGVHAHRKVLIECS
jgi:hypothetical protein